MWVSLFLLAMLAAIAYMVLIQGLVSAMIVCGLTILSAVFAFAMYEWVAMELLLGPLGDLALPAAFIGTFVVPLGVLRLVLDQFIVRSNLIPSFLDRVMGTGCAIVAAFIATGMMGITIRMTPISNTFLGFQSFNAETGDANSFWLGHDRFAAGMASFMSDGIFGGKRLFSEDHPDFIQEISWSQSAHADTRHVVPRDSVKFVAMERGQSEVPYVHKKKNRNESAEPIEPESGREYLLVRMALLPDAQDEDQKHRFGPRQVRLVGLERKDGPRIQLTPIAIQDDNDQGQLRFLIKDDRLYAAYNNGEVSVVFDVPESFEPEFIEYKIGARMTIPKNAPKPKESSDDAKKNDSSNPLSSLNPFANRSNNNARSNTSSQASTSSTSGRVSGVKLGGGGHKFSNTLPVAMTDYQSAGADGRGDTLSTGHIYGKVSEQSSGSSRKITAFEVPDDKRMFQLDVQVLRAGSTLGKALEFAVKSVKNYKLYDDRGNQVPVYGQIVVADVNGDQVIEAMYYPEEVASTNRGGTRDFRLVKDRHLKRNYQLVYLFLVDPGVKLTKFSTGRKSMDLSNLNLVAPG